MKKGDDLELPPSPEVEHKIPLIDKNPPPKASRRYKVKAGIWKPTTSKHAAPMMAHIKKDGVLLRPTVNLRARSSNTEPMVMPPVDQDEILNAVAAAKFCAYADLHGAFQQIRIQKGARRKRYLLHDWWKLRLIGCSTG